MPACPQATLEDPVIAADGNMCAFLLVRLGVSCAYDVASGASCATQMLPAAAGWLRGKACRPFGALRPGSCVTDAGLVCAQVREDRNRKVAVDRARSQSADKSAAAEPGADAQPRGTDCNQGAAGCIRHPLIIYGSHIVSVPARSGRSSASGGARCWNTHFPELVEFSWLVLPRDGGPAPLTKRAKHEEEHIVPHSGVQPQVLPLTKFTSHPIDLHIER